MHKYLRTVGFSKYKKKREVEELVEKLIDEAEETKLIYLDDETNRCEIRRQLCSGMGVAFVGEMENNDEFSLEYYYPYVEGTHITSTVPCAIQRHSEKEAFSGLMEDYNLGVSLIFYVSNSMDYVKLLKNAKLATENTDDENTYVNIETAGSLNDLDNQKKQKASEEIKTSSAMLTGLSISGKVILPVKKTKQQEEVAKVTLSNRCTLIEAAKNGDEEAMESLTIEDMDTYDLISRRLITEDVYSIVESSFIPCGVECDQYAMLGEIMEINEMVNPITEETIYDMAVYCNNLMFHVAINKKDLMGEPDVGRRFRGKVWLQGVVNFETGE